MRRRTFIAALGGAAVLPLAPRAQQAMPVIGFLRSTLLVPFAYLGAALRQGLATADDLQCARGRRCRRPDGCEPCL